MCDEDLEMTLTQFIGFQSKRSARLWVWAGHVVTLKNPQGEMALQMKLS